MGKAFPVLSTLGGLSFFPYAQKAAKNMDRLEDFSARTMKRHQDKLNGFLKNFEKRASQTIGTEQALHRALATSVRGVLLELFTTEQWRTNPLLYPLTAFTGVHSALTQPEKNNKKIQRNTCKRLRAVPQLLAQVDGNIEAVTPANRAAAQTIARHSARYLQSLASSPLLAEEKDLPNLLEDCLIALKNYDKYVASRTVVEEQMNPSLETILHEGYDTPFSIAEIHALAQEEWEHTRQTLRELASEFGSPDWRSICTHYQGPECLKSDVQDESEEAAAERILRCIESEMARLQEAFPLLAGNKIVQNIPLSIEVAPAFMNGTLKAVSYIPPYGTEDQPTARLLISPTAFFHNRANEFSQLSDSGKAARISLAYESVPGRHILACHRLSSEDSVIAQLRNPIMEEGWKAVTEELLVESGYMESPGERFLLGWQRLRSAARCLVDTGLSQGNIDLNHCLVLLEQSGIEKEQALREIRDIRMKPGSGLAPVLGKATMQKLRQDSGLAPKDFHQALLQGGESSPAMAHIRIQASRV